MTLSKDPSKCQHYVEVQVWVEREIEDWHGEIHTESNWEWERTEYMDDLDLHRLQCSYCGAIDYYSSAARGHFEGDEKKDWIDESNKRYLRDRNR